MGRLRPWRLTAWWGLQAQEVNLLTNRDRKDKTPRIQIPLPGPSTLTLTSGASQRLGPQAAPEVKRVRSDKGPGRNPGSYGSYVPWADRQAVEQVFHGGPSGPQGFPPPAVYEIAAVGNRMFLGTHRSPAISTTAERGNRRFFMRNLSVTQEHLSPTNQSQRLSDFIWIGGQVFL